MEIKSILGFKLPYTLLCPAYLAILGSTPFFSSRLLMVTGSVAAKDIKLNFQFGHFLIWRASSRLLKMSLVCTLKYNTKLKFFFLVVLNTWQNPKVHLDFHLIHIFSIIYGWSKWPFLSRIRYFNPFLSLMQYRKQWRMHSPCLTKT